MSYKRISFSIIYLLALFIIGQESLGEVYPSPTAIVANEDGSIAYVAETGTSQVGIVNLQEDKAERTIATPHSPTGLVLSHDGKTLYVTGEGTKGTLMCIDVDKGIVNDSIEIGHTPMSPVLSSDGNMIIICTRFDNCVSIVDISKNRIVATIPVLREPIACDLSKDGKFLFVANHLPIGPADKNDIAAEISVIDIASFQVIKSIRLLNGSTGLRGLCVSPDGKYVYVTHLLSRYTMPTTQLERGWMNTNALSVIDVESKSLVNTVLLDDVDLGAANPWAIVCSNDGKLLYIIHAGTHEMSVIDRNRLHERLDNIGRGTQDISEPKKDDVPITLSFLKNDRIRISLNVQGPRGICLAANKVLVSGYFSDCVEVMELQGGNKHDGRIINLGNNQPLNQERKGEMLFNDARLCFQQWQSCASCHPDARVDGLNWDLLNDGLGNPKNTKSLLLSHETPPVMVSRIRQNAEKAVRSGIKYIQFSTRPEEDAQAIDAYLGSLTPIKSPNQQENHVNNGKVIFEKAECNRCHTGDNLTDMKSYNVGTGLGRETDQEFDTPTLVEIWRTAPYLYRGEAANLEDVIGSCNREDKHGKTSQLTEQERQDLLAYLRSL